MSYPDRPENQASRARHRARHADDRRLAPAPQASPAEVAAPESYPDPEPPYAYGDDGTAQLPAYRDSPAEPARDYIADPGPRARPGGGAWPTQGDTESWLAGDTPSWPAGGDTSGWSDDGTAWPPEPSGPGDPVPGSRAGHGAPVPGAEPAAGVPAEGAEPAGGQPAPRKRRAGRNLPAAIGVGVTLGAIIVVSLFVWRPAFLGLVTVASAVAVYEMVRALAGTGVRAPLVPLVLACPVMAGLAWYGGTEPLVLGLMLSVVAVLVWRLADGPVGYQRDVVAATLIAVYVPFLAAFAAMLAQPHDGARRVVLMIAAVVLSDTGGYVAGVFFGSHPMAPRVSPKKSWEGLAGSLVATAAGGALLLALLMHRPWWYGALFGLAVSVAAVLGDLTESLLKRDIGVKDMSNLLPGHGGLMDRMDSILFAAPVAFMLLSVLAPVGS